jgi:hypothetical protein
MTRGWRFSIVGNLLTLALLASWPAEARQAAAADGTGTAVPETAPVTVPVTQAELARIRRALEAAPAVRINDDQLRFYMQILVRKPTFAEFAKGYDFKSGATKGGNPMTHSEFLAMVTPKEMQSQVGITAPETLTIALTNWMAQTLVKWAYQELQEAKDEREVQEIRDRIERELAALRAAEVR